MDQQRALVIGGSLGGLFAANLLRSIGWEVAVFERAKGDLAGRGAGLGTRAELFDVMRRVGIDLDGSIGAEVCSRIGLDRNGETICEVPMRTITTAWDRMYRALRTALPPNLIGPGCSSSASSRTDERWLRSSSTDRAPKAICSSVRTAFTPRSGGSSCRGSRLAMPVMSVGAVLRKRAAGPLHSTPWFSVT